MQIYPVALYRTVNYASFIEQWQQAQILLPDTWQQDPFPDRWQWNLDISVRSTACHQFSTGCNDVSVDLTGNFRGSYNTYLYAPRDSAGSPTVARSVRQGTLLFRFSHQRTQEHVTIQNRYGNASAARGTISDNYPQGFAELLTDVNYNTGVILMNKLRFLQQSIDPLGVPELGENEFVFSETGNLARLEIPVGCLVLYSPPGFLYGPFWDGLRWYARRIAVESTFGFTHLAEPVWGYANSTRELFIAFRASGSNGLLYQSASLPEWNQYGRHAIRMRLTPRSFADNFSPFEMGEAYFEIFFPATGARHPGNDTDYHTGQRAPNWFHYYWRTILNNWNRIGLVGTPNNVFFTSRNDSVRGYYVPATNSVFITSNPSNYTSTDSQELFRMVIGECGQAQMPLITFADGLTLRGIHAFMHVLYHEKGHEWAFTTRFRSCDNQNLPIAGDWGRPRDLDPPHPLDPTQMVGDSLDDEWEVLNGLCPLNKDTTGAYSFGSYIRLGGDGEVVAEVYAYRHLLRTETVPYSELWRLDWSDQGLQYGNPLWRFRSFPWTYESTGTNRPLHSDLLTNFPRPNGCR